MMGLIRSLSAVAVPVLLLLLLSAVTAHYQTQRQTDELADNFADHSRLLLADAQSSLRKLAVVAEKGCSGESLAMLRAIPYHNPAVREAAIVDHAALLCTTWGVHQPPIPIHPEHSSWQPGKWLMFAMRGSAFNDVNVHSLVLGLGTSDHGGVNLLIDPDSLFLPLQGKRDYPFTGEIALANGQMLGAIVQPGSATAYPLSVSDRRYADSSYRRVRAVGNGLLVLEIAVSRDLFIRNWLKSLPLFLVVGLLLSGGAMWLVHLLRRPPSLRNALRRGIDRGEFHVAYLPTMVLPQGRCVGAEALLRWHHPQQGAMAPDTFIPFAERTGLILPLTDWLLQRAFTELGPWLNRDESRYLAINLCARHFAGAEFVDTLIMEAARYRIAPHQVMLELTEREMLDLDEIAVVEVLARLRGEGFRLAIDDFGIGYNNLARLMDYRFDQIKIDKSLVQAIGRRDGVEPLLDGVLTIARGYGSTLVAEGVETPEQAAFLGARGVTLVQGYHFAQPLEAPAFIEFADERHPLA